jgi:ABC-type lipoprotein export system ATPase subunit
LLNMGRLELHGVVKHHRTAGGVVRAVEGVTLTVEAGEVVALHGPSGSGKTTLLRLAGGMLAPDAGVVRFDGRDLATLAPRELDDHKRREVGFASCDVELLPGVPALDNAAVKLLADRVPLGVARRRTAPWLERVGLGDRLDAVPARLSGGERQRVAIARALVNGPRLVLADEPTSRLEGAHGDALLALLVRVARERPAAVLIATHDPRVAEAADRALALHDGVLAPYAPVEPRRTGAIALVRHR